MLKSLKNYFCDPEISDEVRKYKKASEMINKATKSGIWMVDFKTNKISWSESMYDIYDKPLSWEINNEDLIAMVHKDYLEEYKKIALLHESGNTRNNPFLYKIDTGKNIKYLEVRTVLDKDEKGNLLGMYGSVQDVTKRILREQQKEIFINSLKLDLARKISKEEIKRIIEKLSN